MYRTAIRITANAADAEDVLQTLFLRLYRREIPPDLVSNPRAYIYRATVNIALDLIRSRRNQTELEDTEVRNIPDSPGFSRGEEEINDRLMQAIAELNPKSAEILILRYVHGFTHEEIAKLLGTSRGTVAVSLFRSRSYLRKSIRTAREKS